MEVYNDISIVRRELGTTERKTWSIDSGSQTNYIMHTDFQSYNVAIAQKDKPTIYLNDSSRIYAAQMSGEYLLSIDPIPGKSQKPDLQIFSISSNTGEKVCDTMFLTIAESDAFDYSPIYDEECNISYIEKDKDVCIIHASPGLNYYVAGHQFDQDHSLVLCTESNKSCVSVSGSGSYSTRSGFAFSRITPHVSSKGVHFRTYPDDDQRFPRSLNYSGYVCESPITSKVNYCNARQNLSPAPSATPSLPGSTDDELHDALIQGTIVATVVIFVFLLVVIAVCTLIFSCCMNQQNKNKSRAPNDSLPPIILDSQPLYGYQAPIPQPAPMQPQPTVYVAYPQQPHPIYPQQSQYQNPHPYSFVQSPYPQHPPQYPHVE